MTDAIWGWCCSTVFADGRGGTIFGKATVNGIMKGRGMTPKERFSAAMRGDPVDRPPIWLREGFPIVQGPAGEDDFRNCWQADPLYRELYKYVRPHVVADHPWKIPCVNRFLMVPPRYIRAQEERISTRRRRTYIRVKTGKGELTQIVEHWRGVATGWVIKPLIESREELKALADVPFDIDRADIDCALNNYRRASREAGDAAVLRFGLPSPIVAISGCMTLEMFLELSLLERRWFTELESEITRRIECVIEALFAKGDLDTTANFGGSEQCTPPLMPPEAYDELVVPFDGPLIRNLRQRKVPVNVHCHGKVRHALRCMRDMGVDATDPVEPPPAGDVTYAEARQIVDGRVTLVGNFAFDELESAEPHRIRERVKQLLSHGTDRLILGASAGPLSSVSQRLVDNYKAWIDAALELG